MCFIKQKTAYERRISDWSSDVCSSDLALPHLLYPGQVVHRQGIVKPILVAQVIEHGGIALFTGHGQDRIAGQYFLQTEDHDGYEYQRGYGNDNAAQDKLKHAMDSCLALNNPPGLGDRKSTRLNSSH